MSGSIYASRAMLPGSYDYETQLREQDDAAKQFALAAQRFLEALYPAQTFLIETLRESFVGWVCCGTERQLKSLAEAKTRAIPTKTAEEEMVWLSDRRDKLMEEIQKAEAQLDELPEDFPMAPMMDLALIAPMRKELDFVEAQISSMTQYQALVEDTNPQRAGTSVQHETQETRINEGSE